MGELVQAELCGGLLDGELVTVNTEDSPGDLRCPVRDGDDMLYRRARRLTAVGRVAYELVKAEPAR